MAYQIIAICNLKGGTSKTTLACNLAHELKGFLLDADEQGASEAWRAMGRLGIDGISLPLSVGASDAAIDQWGETIGSIDVPLLLIDCPPTLGRTSNAAMLLADLVIIPTGPSGLDLQACMTTLEYLRRARELREEGAAALLIPAKCDLRTSAGKELSGVLGTLGEPVSPMVGLRISFVDSATLGMSVCQYAPRSQACQEIKRLAKVIRRALKGV